ncbi:MAG: glycosyltransferase family 1 protein [Bacteroidales bacterium]|nr:glycosyltransferase family 1 protein [Bacteroidales bacterium]
MGLRIAVNTRLLIKNKLEGIGWFTYENLIRIVKDQPETTFYFIFDRHPDPSFLFAKNVIPVVLHPPARHPFLFIIWFDWSVRRYLKKLKPDLFLSPDGYLSLGSKIPDLAVMHDLNFEHYPEDLPFLMRSYYRYFFPRFARKASRVATVSEFSKQDIVEQYGVAPEKIDVVYNGANEHFNPLNEAQQAVVRAKYTNGHAYFLFVGSLHPRKNLARLFKAFDIFCNQSDSSVRLLIAGEKKWWTEPIQNAFDGMEHQGRVIFCGRLNSDELHQVTASALAITYVSYFEGFGIPIVEAFRCGVPVITSNVTSMPEVAGDAALLVDPFDENAIANAMQQMVEKPDFRDVLISRGFERAKLFSWDQAAQNLWQSMLATIKESKINKSI